MVMPRAGFEATILDTIISDMPGITHCLGVIVPQCFKNWVCFHLHVKGVLGRFLIGWGYHKELLDDRCGAVNAHGEQYRSTGQAFNNVSLSEAFKIEYGSF